MKKATLFFACVIVNFLNAQISVNNTDMPVSGDTLRMSTTSTIGSIDVTQTGPGFNWDYSTLVAQIQDVDTFVAVSSTPYPYQFYFNNSVLYPKWKANFAQKVPNPASGVGTVSITNVYDYFKNISSEYSRVGFGANVNGLPTSIKFDSLDVIYRFPLDYTDSDSSISKFAVSIPGLGYYGQRLKRVNVVDGWGTLTTPYGTFQVLRVKSSIAQRDTFFSTQFGVGYAVNLPPRIEYKWLAKGQKVPVLQVNAQVAGTSINVQSAVYRDSIRKDAAQVGIVLQTNNGYQGAVFPNPAQFYVQNYSYSFNESVQFLSFEILDLTGKNIHQKKYTVRSQTGTVGIAEITNGKELKEGIYLLRVNTEKGSFLQKFSIY